MAFMAQFDRLGLTPMPGGQNVVDSPDPDALLTGAQAARICGVQATTIRDWGLPVATVQKGRNMYRLADIALAHQRIRPDRRRGVPGLILSMVAL